MRLERDIQLKAFFAHHPTTDISTTTPKLYVKSLWSPPPTEIPPWVDARLSNFFTSLRQKFQRRKATPNLLPFQRTTMQTLRNNQNLLFPDTDKGLGPCAVTYEQYVTDALLHLSDTSTFTRLTETEAWSAAQGVENQINAWLKKYKQALTKDEAHYITSHLKNNRHSPFGQFYISYKVHKTPTNGRYPTRPVCSDVSSLPHGLGKWVDLQLQPIAHAQPSYFKDSFTLKDTLSKLTLPPNALFFTADAKSMYTNIRTEPALNHISHLLRTEAGHTFHHYNPDALISALEIVFRNNLIQFGNTYWRQTSRTGMGIAPAPPWATIYFAIHKNNILPCWAPQIQLYQRFIDNVIGIWLSHPCPQTNKTLWATFKQDMQKWHGLEWEFSTLSHSCSFMDLKLTITNGKIHSTLHKKK